MSISTKPYFIRALYEWCQDSGLTPYLVAYVNEKTKVPMQHVKDQEIVLNIGETATQQLTIDNNWVHFHARFSGVAQEIWIPTGNVLSVFARETGEGMGFDLEETEQSEDDYTQQEDASAALPETQTADAEDAPSFLKIIK